MPDELQTGASFGDVLEVEPEDTTSTPEEDQETTPAATEGGTPSEPEVPGVLKETPAENEEEEGKPDLSLDKDLEGHPVLKAKWEAYVAQKEKGINQFIEKNNAALKEAQGFQEQYQPLVDFYNEFDNAETVDAAFGRMCATLAKTYGRPFGGYDAQGGQSQPVATPADGEEGEPKSKYGFEFASDDKIMDTVLGAVRAELKELKEAVGPITKKFETDAQTEAIKSKAAEAMPHLKSAYDTTADPWVTQEMVEAAVREFPTLEPATAFKAKYADEIAKYVAKHAGGKKAVRNLPTGETGGKTRGDLKPGADFFEILQSEATL